MFQKVNWWGITIGNQRVDGPSFLYRASLFYIKRCLETDEEMCVNFSLVSTTKYEVLVALYKISKVPWLLEHFPIDTLTIKDISHIWNTELGISYISQ